MRWFYISFIVGSLVGSMVFTAFIQQDSYESKTYKHCKQYEVVPIEYIDRVPSGCTAQYFESRAK